MADLRLHHRRPYRPGVPALLAGALAFALAAAAASARAQTGGRGYLFGAPSATFSIRGGWDAAQASGGLYDFVRDELTLGRRSFDGANVSADFAIRVADRIDLTLGGGYAESRRGSEFRRFVDNRDQPIEQTTSLRRAPITAGLRLFLLPRGRTLGQLAWVPARLSPYVGASVGRIHYRFQQQGDFVDTDTRRVFPATLTASAWSNVAQAAAGIEWTVSPHVLLTTEARQSWANAPVTSYDFRDVSNRINLNGLALTAGVGFRF